jgi:hypothetical protein
MYVKEQYYINLNNKEQTSPLYRRTTTFNIEGYMKKTCTFNLHSLHSQIQTMQTSRHTQPIPDIYLELLHTHNQH